MERHDEQQPPEPIRILKECSPAELARRIWIADRLDEWIDHYRRQGEEADIAIERAVIRLKDYLQGGEVRPEND